jgi:hypothetical protein
MNNQAAKIISDFKEGRDKLIRAKLSLDHTLLGAGHVVRVGKLHMTFDVRVREVIGGGMEAVNGRIAPLLQCARFTKEDAEKIASGCSNGAGEKGEAVHIRDAVRDQIAEYDAAIHELELVA